MTTLTEDGYDVFLSHNYADAAWTEQLAKRLESEMYNGKPLKVFYSERDIRPGQSIPKRMQDALTNSRKVVLILSPESVKSGWVEVEYLSTLYADVSELREHLIPIMRRDCKPPYLIAPLRYIDFRDGVNFERAYKDLLAVIRDEPLPPISEPISEPRSALPASIPRPPAVGFVARRDTDGRDIVERLKEELEPEKNQLVVLWGAGGVGKTTVAAEAAQALGEVFGRRMVWASPELRTGFTFTTLLDEIATQLGHADLRESKLEVKEEQVRALLAEANTLVVLDNFETIKTNEQERCAKWLKQGAPCPALITTRQRVDGAHNIAINAMLPEEAKEFAERWIKREAHSPRAFEGVELDSIIETADRNPRIMEWVLARIDLAGDPEEVLEELKQGEGDAAQRVFDGSFDLPQLTDDGRDALLALSLFVPDASRDALSEVAGFGSDAKKRLNDAVTRLSSLWLVEATEGNKRLRIAGLTRELAKNRLSKETRAGEFRQRFVAYFVRYVKEHRQMTPEDFAALEAEKDNMLDAMDLAFDMKDWESVQSIALVLANPVYGMLGVHGYWDETIRRNEQARLAANLAKNKLNEALFVMRTAIIRKSRGEYDEARREYQQALSAFKGIESRENVAAVLHNLAVIAQAQGDLIEARRLYDESLEISRRLGDQSGIARTLHELGRLAQSQGELAEARRLYNESLEISKNLGNQSAIASTLHQLGWLAQDEGELAEARRLYNESLEISKNLGNQSFVAITLHQLGWLAQDEGELEEARRLYDESLEIKKRLGDQSGIARTLHELGRLAQSQGELAEARRLYNESLEIEKRLGDQSGLAISLQALGTLAHSQGDLEEARRLYGESLEASKKLGDKSNIAFIYYNLGLLEEGEKNREEAARLFREALSMFEKLKSPYAEKARRSLERVEGEGS